MNKLLKLLLIILCFGCNTRHKNNKEQTAVSQPVHFIGFYEYKAESGKRNQYVLIDTLQGKFYGIYYRTEPKRGKGVWYYANSLTNLKVIGDSISFAIGRRKLFSSRPIEPGQRVLKLPDNPNQNGTNDPTFRGIFQKGNLQLECRSTAGNCPSKSMSFQKIPLAD